MSLIRITNPKEIRPAHAVMLGLVILAVAGNCLLTSAGKPHVLPDGAVEWDPDSLLLAAVEILDLHYAQPTPNGVAVKALVHGLASGLGLIVTALGLVFLARGQDGPSEMDTLIDVEHVDAEGRSRPSIVARQLDPILTAQVLLLLYVGWSFASQLWSHAPEFAQGGAILLAIQVAWAFSLAYGLNRQSAKVAAYILLIVLSVTAGLAVLYHDQRNAVLRASYPIGNPLFLAACLIPGILLAVVTVVSGTQDFAARRPGRALAKILLAAPAAALLVYTFELTQSRGPSLALALGLIAMVFYASGRKVKIAVSVLAIAGLAYAGSQYYSRLDAPSPTGRSASMRVRMYSWPYGLDLIRQAPLTGHGEGGYTLLADAFAIGDVESDPEPLANRIAHAHSEWIEVGSDLGSMGLVLVLGVLFLTLLGGARAAATLTSRAQRWVLIALLAALTALIVEECFNVALRIEGLPLVYFTVIGLIWALARPVPAGLLFAFARRKWLCGVLVLSAAAAGLAIMEYARRDFGAARAAYDLNPALERGDWDKANQLAHQAYADRLSPQRKLTALRNKIAAHAHIAERLQEQYLRRRRAAESRTDRDPALHDLAADSRRDSENQAGAGLMDLQWSTAIAPSELNTGRLEHRLQSVLANYAELDGDTNMAADFRAAAANALKRQIARQPYSSELAAIYVMSDPRLPLPEAIELLARPLRTQRVPAIYLDLMSRMAAVEPYTSITESVLADARAQLEHTDAAQWTDRWAPEKLRLDAVARFPRADYAAAAESLRTAAKLYHVLGKTASLATASCYAELADTLFFLQPDNAQPAIDSAEESLKHAPRSQQGRALCDAIGVRLVTYHLALFSQEHEDFARKLIREHRPKMNDEAVDLEIANRYVRLAYSVFDRAAHDMPGRLAAWSRRALQLDPESAMAWSLAADVAIQKRDDAEAVRCVNEVIRFGGELEDIMALIERGLRAMPDSENLKIMRDHMQTQIEKLHEENAAPPAS